MKTVKSALALVLTAALLFGPSIAFAQLTPPVTPPVTPPADTTPPVISGIVVASLSSVSESVVWTTNELAVSTFEYGTTQSYGSTSALSASAAIGGTATLTSLLPSTLYYYCIHATDTSNNASQSCGSFTSAAAPDITAPIVSLVVAVATTTSASITWTTSENADAQVQYGTTQNYGSSSTLNTTLGLTHSVELSGLSAETTYHYRILSRDAAGNLTTGNDNTFTTGALPSVGVSPSITDTTPPVITDISSVSLEPNIATILWTTDELATSTLEYGTTMSYGSTATLPITALLIHTATLLGLSANTTYYYCIHATDLFTNTASSCSNSNTFITASHQVMLDTIPPTISLVTVAPITTTTAGVTWTTSEIGNGYVEYGTNDGYGSQTPLDTALTLEHSTSISGLTANTVYHYRVHSSDQAGNASITPDEIFTTAAPTPVIVQTPVDHNAPVIGNVTDASVASTNVTISWTTDEPAVSTFVYGTTQSYGMSASLSASALMSGTAILTGLLPSTLYYYCIHATDVSNNTGDSCGHTFTTAASPVIVDTTSPAISLVTVASVSTSSATLAWTTDEAATSRVQYGVTTSYGSETPSTSGLFLTNTEQLSSLSPHTTYHFRIISTDLSGNIATSSDEIFTTNTLPQVVVQAPADTTAPVISGLTVTYINPTVSRVTWTTNEPADSKVEYGTGPVDYESSSGYDHTLVIEHSVNLANLSADTTYHYRVASADASHNTTTSPDTTFMSGVSAPQGPSVSYTSSVTISSVESVSIGAASVVIAWHSNLPADSRVEYGKNMGFDKSTLSASLVTQHSVTLTGLDPDTNYDFRVVSKPAGSNVVEAVSDIYDFTTFAVPVVIDPAANILSVSSSGIGSTNASVAWTTDEATVGLVEYGLTTAYGESTVPSSSQTSSTASFETLLPGTMYHFRIKAVDAADNITYSEDHTFTTSGVPISNISSVETASQPVLVASSGGGGGGGGGYTNAVPVPGLITAASVDSQIVLMWNKPQEGGVIGTRILRKEGSYPASPEDGQVIYQGNGSTFTDTGLQNAKTYYYSAYSYTASGSYSKSVRIATAPKAGVMQVQLDENPVLEPGTATEHFPVDMKIGDSNLEVEHLQQVLNTVNVHQSKLTTGYFGPLTEIAIKKFQTKYNLPQTGIADAATRTVLSSLSQSWVIAGAPNGLADLQTDLKRGDTGQAVSDLQEFLTYEGSYQEGIISGIFGSLTQKSVTNFQTTHGVTPVSGIVGPKTRHTIQTVLGL